MGGRGGKSGLTKVPAGQVFPGTRFPNRTITVNAAGQPVQQPQQQAQAQSQPTPQLKQATPAQNGPIQNQVPDNNNTPVTPNPAAQLKSMSDAQLAQLYNQSKNAQLPNHLNDANDATQKFVFTAGINGRPTVLDQAQFNQFMKDNNIPHNNILSRSINQSDLKTSAGNRANLTPQQIVDMLKYGRLTYIGGKRGGQVYGAGAYFDMNGGRGTGYGNGATMTAVLNPATARTISRSRLSSLAQAFDRSHPLFARATGGYSHSNMSVYALAMGYNVIASGNGGPGEYHNIIDRSALVMLK